MPIIVGWVTTTRPGRSAGGDIDGGAGSAGVDVSTFAGWAFYDFNTEEQSRPIFAGRWV